MSLSGREPSTPPAQLTVPSLSQRGESALVDIFPPPTNSELSFSAASVRNIRIASGVAKPSFSIRNRPPRPNRQPIFVHLHNRSSYPDCDRAKVAFSKAVPP